MIDRGGINSIIRLIHTIVNEKLFHYSRGRGGTGAPPIPPETMKDHPLDPDDGPHTGTLPEDEVVLDDATGHDHQGEGDTGKKVSTDSVLITLTNRTGGQRTAGDVVVTDPDNDESFIGTSGSPGYQGKVLVVAETISSSGSGGCWERGGPFEVNVVGAVDRNDGLRTSATIYKAEAAPSVVSDGVFAIALSTCGGGGGTIKAVFLDVISEGGDGGAGTIEIQEDDAKVADADIVNFEGGGGKVVDEGGGKVTVDITPGAGGDGGGAWTLIEDVELGGDGGIDFEDIPQTYKHLKIIFSLRSDVVAAGDELAIRFNNSAVGYDSFKVVEKNDGLVRAENLNANRMILLNVPGDTAPANRFSSGEIIVPDYVDTDKTPSAHGIGGALRNTAANEIWYIHGAGGWRTQGAVTRITFIVTNGTGFKAGSRATLYGIGVGGGGGGHYETHFLRWSHGVAGTVESNVNNYPVILLDSGEWAMFGFHLPSTFLEIDMALVMILPDATEQIQYDLFSSYGAEGEGWGAPSESSLDITKNVTLNEIALCDVTDVLTGVAAGDYVGINFLSDISTLRVVGLLLRYKTSGGGGAGTAVETGGTTLTNTAVAAGDTWEQWGTEQVEFELDGETVEITASLAGNVKDNTNPSDIRRIRIRISLDNGVSWSDGHNPLLKTETVPANTYNRFPISSLHRVAGSVTTKVIIQAQLMQAAHANSTWESGYLMAQAIY